MNGIKPRITLEGARMLDTGRILRRATRRQAMCSPPRAPITRISLDNGPASAPTHELLTPVVHLPPHPAPMAPMTWAATSGSGTETALITIFARNAAGRLRTALRALTSRFDGAAGPTDFSPSLGFRVAYVPEPSTIVMLFPVAIIGIFLITRHRSFSFFPKKEKGHDSGDL